MNFFLTGFSSDLGFRVFEFEGVGEDKSRTDFWVRADLALIKDYGIRVQELPLLCRGLLEDHDQVAHECLLTFTREHMQLHAELCAAERAATQSKRAKYRRPFRPVPTAAVPAPRQGGHI